MDSLGFLNTTGELEPKDIGRWVRYHPIYGYSEDGRIKSWNNKCVFVVYKCDNKWDEFLKYTAEATHPLKLEFIKAPEQ